ncbi:MAG: OmpH family outer membrane protein [Alphaproteobacteria bacterium]|nr:OmpH family outer membrane protein [Alphaproteobacteria bacterium]
MKKSYVVLLVVLGVLLAAYGLCSFTGGKKIAVVDVQRIVNQAQPVVELRQDMQNQMSNLKEWVDASNAEINKESSKDKKDALSKQKGEEFLQKQQAIQRDYAQKLQALDARITKIIETVAKKEGCGITLIKGSVAAGGLDITEKVLAKIAK